MSIIVLAIRSRAQWKHIMDTLMLNGYSALWFLPGIFFAECGAYFILCGKKVRKIGGFLLVILLSLMGNEFYQRTGIDSYVLNSIANSLFRAATGAMFIFIGYYGYRYIEKVKSRSWYGILIALMLFVAGVFLAQKNGIQVEVVKNRLNNPLLFYLSANFCAWTLIFIAKNLDLSNKILCFFGKNSLIILVTHIPMSIVSIVKWKMPFATNNYYADCFVVFIIVMMVEVVLIIGINSKCPFVQKVKKVVE